MKIFYTTLLLISIPLFACQTSQIKTDNDKVQVNNVKNKYDLPIELNTFHECEDKTEKVYKIDKELNFEYFENEKSNKFKISDNDKKILMDLLLKNDLYELNKKSEKIPENAPQTEECRSISQLNLILENKNNLFELNDRKLYHTKEYNEAFNNIKNKLDEIRKNNSNSVSSNTYSLPIIYKEEMELNGKMHEIKIDKDYNLEVFNIDQKTKKTKINKEDIDIIIKKLQEQNIDKLFEKSEKVPDDAPQTKELRTIMSLTLNFNNSEKFYDRNGRKYIHTEEYINAFDNIVKEIKSIISKYFNDKEINIGEELLLNNDYKLKAIKIVEDSRCPDGAQCVWAGRVIVKFQILKNGDLESEFDLGITPEKDTFENSLFKIKLTDVSKSGKSVLQISNK